MDSNDVQKLCNVAYINSQTASALIELEAMKTENNERDRHGHAPAWSEGEFMSLIDKYQLGHNAVMTNLKSGLQ
jgi:hypothetical protein